MGNILMCMFVTHKLHTAGGCSLLICLIICLYCQVNMLRERNKSYGTIKFVDISSYEYSPEENQGLDYKTVCK